MRIPLLLCLFVFAGCDWDESDIDHDPPEGFGALVVDNNTSSEFRVFVNGERLQDAERFDDQAYDLPPGTVRVVLDEKDGNGSFRDDVDIIENRNTVLDLTFEEDFFGFDDLDVVVFFDD